MGSGVVAALAAIAIAPACGRLQFAPVAGDATGADSRDDAERDANGDGAAATCPPSVLLCDLFDDTFDTVIWDDNSGTFNVDTTVARRGASSLRFSIATTPANTQVGSYISHTGPEIGTATALWIRAWFRLSALPAATNALEIMAVQRNGALGNFVFVRSDNTELYHQIDFANGAAGVAPPVNTWFCLAWKLTFATTNTGSSEVTSDVLPAFSITNSTTQTSPAMDNVGFGPFFANNNVDVMQPAFDVWVDDIIVDDALVTCAD